MGEFACGSENWDGKVCADDVIGRQVYSRGDPGDEGEGFVEESGEFDS